MFSLWPLILAGLLVVSLVSYGWAMRNFFTKPAGDQSGMKLVRLSGTVTAALHGVAYLLGPATTPVQGVAAAGIYVAALFVFFAAFRAHGHRPPSAVFSPDRPSRLVHWGPYRYIRHPFYSAYLLTWTAGVIGTGRLWLAPSVLLMGWIYVRAANMEEKKFALSALSDEYQRYADQTGMFFPKPHRLLKLRRKEADEAALAQPRT